MRSLKMIKQFVSSSVCLKCQGCCRFAKADTIWSPCLLNEEIKILLEKRIPPSLISYDKRIRLAPYLGQDSFTPPLRAGSGFICSFFSLQDNKCKIYAFRPFECELYPFLIGRQDKKVFMAVDLKCPFIKENLKNRKFKEYTRYLTSLLNSSRWLNILKNNPHIIQEYTEVLNLAKIRI